ncbi:uncharacterized protein LOC129984671 [Argiope bruennichi]|uniref:Uncharacterized protein n=1 Tax=Argiope bruennichi TaxID=94029 RepID=A0A8T0EG96_ARGBR|nr:uncharacterized protein LOC129984671 [Argiope bruennichi]XP_055950573.1 uncharacterized protein LOC129984671 [Argiope bruennichi]XP_055950574.1 uncharacterized protein LOC129984671 [Argiope bruennichi]KAF8773023.1 hypothetical protein HNY73_015719 [Argiope bruennichi]
MDICLVPSLQHLSCSEIVISLLNKLLPFIDISCLCYSDVSEADRYRRKYRDENYKLIRNQVVKDIANLSPYAPIQKKLESFIAPLFGEIEAWINTCSHIWTANDDALFIIMQNIPHCWLTEGVIDREKSAKSVIKNSNVHLTIRFIFACFYCVYEDVLYLWKQLSEREKTYLREEYLPKDFDFVVKQWIEWLESWLNKDWQYCVAWILGTPLWDMNAYVLRRVLLALTPLERRHYVPKALIGRRAHERESEAIRFCLSVLAREEREVVFRESPDEVIKCMTSWPLRTNSLAIEDRLWSYLTADTFYDILCMLLGRIRQQKRDDSTQLLAFLKYFWEKSPNNFRRIAENRRSIFSKPLRLVLDHDLTEVFPIWKFLNCFGGFPTYSPTYWPKDLPIEDGDDLTRQHSNSQSSLQCCVIL